MKNLRTSLTLLFMATFVCLSCSRADRLIPIGRMSDIYADIFVADQWLRDHPGIRHQADTTLYYDPLFQKYGYNRGDFVYSVSYYIDKPDKYSKILRDASEKIHKEAEKFEKLSDQEAKAMLANAKFHTYEAMDFSVDSLVWKTVENFWKPVLDTSKFVEDSLVFKDSLTVDEVVPIKDTPMERDSVTNGEAIPILKLKDTITDVKRKHSIRPDKKQAIRKFAGSESASGEGESLQF